MNKKNIITAIICLGSILIIFILLCTLCWGKVSYSSKYINYGEYHYSNIGENGNTGETFKIYIKTDCIYEFKKNGGYTYKELKTDKWVSDETGKEEISTHDSASSIGMYQVVEDKIIFYPSNNNRSFTYTIMNGNLCQNNDIKFQKEIGGLEIILIILLILAIIISTVIFVYKNKKDKKSIVDEKENDF